MHNKNAVNVTIKQMTSTMAMATVRVEFDQHRHVAAMMPSHLAGESASSQQLRTWRVVFIHFSLTIEARVIW